MIPLPPPTGRASLAQDKAKYSSHRCRELMLAILVSCLEDGVTFPLLPAFRLLHSYSLSPLQCSLGLIRHNTGDLFKAGPTVITLCPCQLPTCNHRHSPHFLTEAGSGFCPWCKRRDLEGSLILCQLHQITLLSSPLGL